MLIERHDGSRLRHARPPCMRLCSVSPQPARRVTRASLQAEVGLSILSKHEEHEELLQHDVREGRRAQARRPFCLYNCRAMSDVIDDRTASYVIEVHPHFEDLRHAAAQLAGVLVLAASGSKEASPHHP